MKIVSLDQCGWCGADLTGKDPTSHAIDCKAQPWRFYKEAFIAELTRLHGDIPPAIQQSLDKADDTVCAYITIKRWGFTVEQGEGNAKP